LANRWAEEPDTTEQPKSDLNPLLNPVLEENLGRWAQVYFTNPPEKRERAVMDLLRELETRTPEQAAELPGPESVNRNAGPNPEKMQCTICNAENLPEQRFCGFCGTPLRAQRVPAAEPSQSAPNGMSFLGLSSAPSAPPESDLAFLREKSFEQSYYEPESGTHRAGYIITALILLIAGIGYLNWPVVRAHVPAAWQPWAQRRTAATVAPPTSTKLPEAAARDSAPVNPSPTMPAQPSPQATAGVRQEPPVAALANTQHTPASASADSTAGKVKLASDAHASHVAAADGTQELLVAQHYLHEGSTPANNAEAARWLWKSVGKQNPQAALLLANMYARGDGVSKSCDQARILLGAAAKKGAPGAAANLRNLESGCR
jgi:hypothetical protein